MFTINSVTTEINEPNHNRNRHRMAWKSAYLRWETWAPGAPRRCAHTVSTFPWRRQNTLEQPQETKTMNTIITTYLAYLAISVSMTVWVARTLHKNGRVFLVESFGGAEEKADSVNHLLVVGFYLINLGFVLLYLRDGARPESAVEALEILSGKLGVVLLALGGMHFLNLAIFNKMRHRPAPAAVETPAVPPAL